MLRWGKSPCPWARVGNVYPGATSRWLDSACLPLQLGGGLEPQLTQIRLCCCLATCSLLAPRPVLFAAPGHTRAQSSHPLVQLPSFTASYFSTGPQVSLGEKRGP